MGVEENGAQCSGRVFSEVFRGFLDVTPGFIIAGKCRYGRFNEVFRVFRYIYIYI